MDNLNRDNILDMHSEQLGFYKTHINILTLLTIMLRFIIGANIIIGIFKGTNIFDIYTNPLFYCAVFNLVIIWAKLLTLYNFKKIGIYIVYILNGLIQIIFTVWFVVMMLISAIAPIIITILVLFIFICISIINISIIVNYYKLRDLFVY